MSWRSWAMRVIALHNPAAGSSNISAKELLAALRAGGIDAEYLSSKEQGLDNALRGPLDLVVVAGGDGTVVKAISFLRGSEIPIAILPLGGANNIARSLGINADPLEMARQRWREAELRRLDIGTTVGPWGEHLFVEAVGMGVLAEAVAAVDRLELASSARSHLAREVFHQILSEAAPQTMKLTLDGQIVEGRFLLAEIMNIASTGPRLALAPAAEPGDGLLDLVCLEAEARTEMLDWLESGALGTPPLVRRRGRAVVFEWAGARLHVDDTFPTPPANPCIVQAELLPDPITVLVPKGAESRRRPTAGGTDEARVEPG